MKKELADASEATFVSSSVRRVGSPSISYLDNASGQLSSRSNITSQYTVSQYMDHASIGGQATDVDGQGTSVAETGTPRISPREASSRASELQASLEGEPASPKATEMVADVEKVWKDDMLGSSLHFQEFEDANRYVHT